MIKTSYGICLGASTISVVMTSLEDGNIKIVSTNSYSHEGNPKVTLGKILNTDGFIADSVVFTGRKFRKLLNAKSISEPEAIEESIKFLKLFGQDFALASLGGESFIVYHINDKGSIDNVITGSKCASGTGEFFLQQIGRMDLNLNEAVNISSDGNPHIVSGRCSVFCKSDCTHALNKGIPKSQVVKGLSKMIADKAIELISKQKSKKLAVIGGVSQNKSVVNYLIEKYPETFIPEFANQFEALGASLFGLNKDYKLEKENAFIEHTHSFSTLEPLNSEKARVTFKSIKTAKASEGDECIIGLDVGSTTTKAVIIRTIDDALIGSVYLKTNGNPVKASVDCYKELEKQIITPIKIIGLGTTGSGRNIAALHALTYGVVNEIIAHAVAAAHFDKEVDTIFEIGGQDAKYTHLTNGIASDYAMNEACSAGTGSFLEESAKETLNIYYKDIGDIALTAKHPLNFNDQCAAFISSDIKNAGHEGASREDIVAGLVYSICMNYVNRVKGNRPVGKKVFMQGGVCYNKAVPYAMSILVNKEIIVPPEPGLMGAFGVALEIKNRIALGLLDKGDFKLNDLIARSFSYGNEFVCAGGSEKCDRKCGISLIEVEGKKYPFGGACNKYYNERHSIRADAGKHNYVNIRQDLVFNKYLKAKIQNETSAKTIGISRSLLTNSVYPLYYNFFTKLGYKVILSEKPVNGGLDKLHSSFCFPVELAHGFFQNLVDLKPDYLFLPHITQMDSHSEHQHNRLCVFVQGECYYLKSAFREELGKDIVVLSPVIDFTKPETEIEKVFAEVAINLGSDKKSAREAFRYAFKQYNDMLSEFRELGKQALANVERDPDSFGVVLFGRAYNAFAREANLNIPHKFASKNITIIPFDFLPNDIRESYENMYWYSGHQILANARFVKRHKQLYGVYITNYSCGPDSFILSYFRRIMGVKPSLTLELDSHSADVGVDTRIDAAIDIIRNFIELNKKSLLADKKHSAIPLRIISEKNHISILDSRNNKVGINSKDVEVLIPSMGHYSSDAFSAIFRSLGINCRPLPVPDFGTLQHGRGGTTCKECLPFILTTGSLTEYIEKHYNPDKKLLFFMPHGYGPCRQGQYHIMLKDIITNMKIENVGVLTMDDENAFDDFGSEFFTKQWISLLIADVIHDIESIILSIGTDVKNSMSLLETEWKKIVSSLETGDQAKIFQQLELSADNLSSVKLKIPLKDAKVISLIGEIYVRREEYSRSELMTSLINRGFVVRTAPITEYVYYTNYLLKNDIVVKSNLKEKTLLQIKDSYQRILERKVKKILARTGLYNAEMVDIEKTMEHGRKLVSESLIGEGILTVGLGMRDILDSACGVVSIGPFNCIPSRLSEAILNTEMTLEGKYRNLGIGKNGYPEELTTLPFLYVETDGNAFPQITQSKIEIFMMQAEKVHKMMKDKAAKDKNLYLPKP